jgi:thioredoxin 1
LEDILVRTHVVAAYPASSNHSFPLMASANVLVLNEANFEAEVGGATVPVLVDFWGEYCGSCRAMEPVLDQLADEQNGKLKVCKVNMDQHPELGARFNVRALPTFAFFKEGKLADSVTGARSKDALLKKALAL